MRFRREGEFTEKGCQIGDICTHQQFLTLHEHSVITVGQKNQLSCDTKVRNRYTHNLYTLKLNDTFEHYGTINI